MSETDYLTQIENLVFEGGGIKGIAFLGALQVLENHQVLSRCKRFAGSSAGAITASLLACGYTCEEVSDKLFNQNWMEFIPEGKISQVRDLAVEWGLHTGDAFVSWLGKLIAAKLDNAKCTFEELFQKTGHELVVTASCINRRMQRYFHRSTNPTLPVVDAVRMSMSIPLFFTPVHFEGSLYCDGGLLNNFPLWVFDSPDIPEWCEIKPAEVNPRTLGFKLLSDAEMMEHKKHIYPNADIASFTQYLAALVDGMLEQMDRLESKPGDVRRTVFIPTHTISSTDFALSLADRHLLVDSGQKAMNKFIARGPPHLGADALAEDVHDAGFVLVERAMPADLAASQGETILRPLTPAAALEKVDQGTAKSAPSLDAADPAVDTAAAAATATAAAATAAGGPAPSTALVRADRRTLLQALWTRLTRLL